VNFERAKVRGWGKRAYRCCPIVAQVKVKTDGGIYLSVWRTKDPQELTIDLDDMAAFRLGHLLIDAAQQNIGRDRSRGGQCLP
jgi:hypothetical protein